MKWILLFMTLMVTVSFAANEDVRGEFSIDSYEANDTVNLTASCVDLEDAVPCNGNVECKITLYHPNLSILVENKTMTLYKLGLFNLTIDVNITQTIGVYAGYITCVDTSNANVVGASDATFRVVDSLLYHGGGIQTFDIAIVLGLALLAFVLAIFGVFGKSLWLRTLMLFTALTVGIVLSDILLKIANLNSQSGVAGVLEGNYSMILFITIFALGLFLVNFLWDLAESLGLRAGSRKKETLDE